MQPRDTLFFGFEKNGPEKGSYGKVEKKTNKLRVTMSNGKGIWGLQSQPKGKRAKVELLGSSKMIGTLGIIPWNNNLQKSQSR